MAFFSFSSSSFKFNYFFWFLLPLFIAYYIYPLMSPNQQQHSSSRQVLPTNVKPFHYDIWLKPHLDTFVFDGQVKVNLNVLEPTRVITLNAYEISITSAILVFGSINVSSIDIEYDTKKTQVSLTFPEEAPANSKAVLDIKFKGILNDQMTGFYRSSYKDKQDNTRYLATTQFEPTDARRCFPNWDEPALKATFDVTLVVPNDLTALSNMNVINEEELKGSDNGWKQVKFATTPRMSTYLLAFVVGSFEYIEAYTSGKYNGQPIQTRVYTLPGSSQNGYLALSVATKALEFFAEQFGEPYPLPKIDMVAIPDFEAGAMENWGLVTYRTIYLLFDEKESSIQFKKHVAYTVCHELAHQWFGNLVTMQWWNELYLNESFATWVGWLAVDNIFPDWDIWTSFVNDMSAGLKLDALRSSHAIEVDVADASEIHQIFDAISYDKGASVIRMLSSWLGVDTFLGGIRLYIQRHKLANASSNDLWHALGEYAGLDVGKFMTLWTKHVGYPVLTVQTSGLDSINVTQTRFLSTGDLNNQDEITTWWVPLHMLCSNGQIEPYILTESSQTFKIPEDGLFKLNAGQTAFYRVNYPQTIILQLAEQIKQHPPGKGLLASTADRVGLISDVGSLMVSGEQSTIAFLELARAFEHETETFVWSQLSSHLKSLISAFDEQPEQVVNGLLSVRRQLFGPVVDRLGWEIREGDDDLTHMLRSLAISNAGLSKHQTIIQEAKTRFWSFIQGNTQSLHPNLRSTVFKIVLTETTNNDNNNNELARAWEALLAMYQDENLPSDQRLMILVALGCVKDAELIQRYLAMGETQVRSQDVVYIYSSLSDNSMGRDALWMHFTEHYEALHTRFGKNISLFGRVVESCIHGYKSMDKLKEIKLFFKDKDTKEYDRPLQQALEAVQVHAQWVERDSENVANWITTQL
ncbi:aminopeptidase [Halteromyces radiatus]|uniref:aminopeptidase n=1 Tax=Halteromyces radiatus TaxID=101107 RepID=UPI00221FB4B4|nr:aminopeptidase [Halteromyces radiatus]KAI8093157.1 aminopeptidase [Halteromyces radiatus]